MEKNIFIFFHLIILLWSFVYSKKNIHEIISKINITEYNSKCNEKKEHIHCYEFSKKIENELSINSLEQLNSLTDIDKYSISEIYRNIGQIHYYGFLNKNPNLSLGLSYLIISSYLGNSPSQYILYILISNQLIEQIIMSKEFLVYLKTNSLLNEISKTAYYKNFNYTLEKNINIEDSRSSISLSFLFSSAIGKYPPALSTLANKYHKGYGVKYSCDVALQYYKESAYQTIKDITNRHTKNLYDYRNLINYEYIEKKFNEYNENADILEYYKAEAMKGDIKYIRDLGEVYLFGSFDLKQNFKEAFKWFEYGYKLNDSQCTYYLGELYLNGWGIKQNYKIAFELLTIAANSGYNKAWNSLGYMYYYGLEVPKNIKRAYDYFKLGFRVENDPDSYYNLLTLLIENNKEIIPDYTTAYKYANSIAQNGHTFGSYFFAMMNYFKIGSLIDSCDITIEFFKETASRSIENKIKFENALLNYKNKNYRSSLLIYLELAEEGIESAQINAGLLLKNYDIFLDKEYQNYMAYKYLKMADKNNNIFAALTLGNLYFNGFQTIKKDYNECKKYYKKVINNIGSTKFYKSHAYFNLGLIRNFGLDNQLKNITKADKYFEISAKYENTVYFPYYIIKAYNMFKNNSNSNFIFTQIKKLLKRFIQPKWILFFYISLILYILFCISLFNQKDY